MRRNPLRALTWLLAACCMAAVAVPLLWFILPSGALGPALSWCAALLIAGVVAIRGEPIGAPLLSLLGHRQLEPWKRARRLRVAMVVLALAAIAGSSTLARELDVPKRPRFDPAVPVCYAGPALAHAAGELIKILPRIAGGGHGYGYTPKPYRCRQVFVRGPVAFLPAIVAAVLALWLWLAHRRRCAVELDRADVQRRAAFVRLRESSSHGHRSDLPPFEDAAANRSAPQENAPALDLRAGALRHFAATISDFSSLFQRAPTLSVAACVYLSGWVLELAGSNIPTQLGKALAPAALRHSYSDWAVLGVWASGIVALVFALLIWWRRRG